MDRVRPVTKAESPIVVSRELVRRLKVIAVQYDLTINETFQRLCGPVIDREYAKSVKYMDAEFQSQGE